MSRTIFGSIIIGIVVFFAFIALLNYYLRPLIYKTTQNIGYAGTYTVQNLPKEVVQDVSYGLTSVSENGEVKPAAASSWETKDGKEYIFKLKKGIKFHNGQELTSSNINQNFKDVAFTPIDKYTIKYNLKNAFSPFLVSVSRPIIGEELAGIGEYKVVDVDLNGGYVRSITLAKVGDSNQKKKIFFYPTQKALKLAFMLGEVSEIKSIGSTQMDDKNLVDWKDVEINDYTDYKSLVSVFYNINDSSLNNKKLRQALNYSLPQSVDYGERAFGPIPPTSIYFSKPPTYKISDMELAKTLLDNAGGAPKEAIEISTTEDQKKVAQDLSAWWGKLGVKSTIKIVNSIPTDFQVFIYEIKLPEDPDQYVLWHTDQVNNITHYKNLRIDKLLEDGRSITKVDDRKKIYADFQKYLTDDVPASFLYFPKVYNVSRVN